MQSNQELQVPDCQHWSYEGTLMANFATIMSYWPMNELARQVYDSSQKRRKHQTTENVKVQEPCCHDMYGDMLMILAEQQNLFPNEFTIFHDQTYTSLKQVIPNLPEETRVAAKKCDYTLVTPHELKDKKKIIFSLELKTGAEDNDIPQIKEYLKKAIDLWNTEVKYLKYNSSLDRGLPKLHFYAIILKRSVVQGTEIF